MLDLQTLTHIVFMCGGNDACDHPIKEFPKLKTPSEITKAMKEWVDAILHQRALVLIFSQKSRCRVK